MSPKDLKKLAAACRKAGIKSFKNGEIEFTLTDEIPSYVRQKKQVNQHVEQSNIMTDGWDSLSEEEKIMWSASGTISEA